MNYRREPSWLSDTRGWLQGNHSVEDVRERHFREQRERAEAKAAREEQFKRASAEIEARRLVLDDDGFQVLGNALLLAWQLDNPRADVLLQREIYSELVDLRSLLEQQGALDPEVCGSELVVPWSVERERVRALFHGNAAFARVRLKDLSPRKEERMPPAVHDALMRATPGELRETIARLGRCAVTQTLRDWVMAYFRGEPFEKPDFAKAGPRPRNALEKERTARRVLSEVFRSDPAARLTKSKAFELLAPHFASSKARQRIWDGIDAPEWKKPGRPSSDLRQVSPVMLSERLSEALKSIPPLFS